MGISLDTQQSCPITTVLVSSQSYITDSYSESSYNACIFFSNMGIFMDTR